MQEEKEQFFEESLVKIETRIAFLEDFLMKIQEVSVQQGKELDALKAENRKIQSKIQEMLENEELLDQRPPHY